MAKQRKTSTPSAAPATTSGESVLFKVCPLFIECLNSRKNDVAGKLREFLQSKRSNRLAPFGKDDSAFIADGPLGKAVPGLRHAHLTHDISILYTIGGKNPTVFQLYAIFTHDESGTGQPANRKKQMGIGQKMANQSFADMQM